MYGKAAAAIELLGCRANRPRIRAARNLGYCGLRRAVGTGLTEKRFALPRLPGIATAWMAESLGFEGHIAMAEGDAMTPGPGRWANPGCPRKRTTHESLKKSVALLQS